MGDSYQIAKETEKVWYLKIYHNGEIVLTQLFTSQQKAQKELIAYLKFKSCQLAA